MYNYYPWYGYPMQSYGGYVPADMARQQGGLLPIEQSYIENILRLNLGKKARVYMTFENNPDWQSQIFTGIIDEAGRDHIVLRDEEQGRWYLLLMIYLDYVEFEEPIEYEYPFDGVNPSAFTQQPPRQD